jgi:hypothetical protein
VVAKFLFSSVGLDQLTANVYLPIEIDVCVIRGYQKFQSALINGRHRFVGIFFVSVVDVCTGPSTNMSNSDLKETVRCHGRTASDTVYEMSLFICLIFRIRSYFPQGGSFAPQST